MLITISEKQGFKNRHIEALPQIKCKIYALISEDNSEEVVLCEWRPFDKTNYSIHELPAAGYLGTAKTIGRKPIDIGYNVWAQNDHDFVYYRMEV